MKISSKLNELKPTDLNCNVFDVYSYDGLSMQDLLCQFFTKINECIKVSNETIDLATWLVNEGLELEVVKQLLIWLEDGTLEEIINVNLFNSLNTKIDEVSKQVTENISEINKKANIDTVVSNLYNSEGIISQILDVCQTYTDNFDKIQYGNFHTAWDDRVQTVNGKFELDCSSFINLLIHGVTFYNSRYNGKYENITSPLFFNKIDSYKYRYAHQIAKYGLDNGYAFTPNKDLSNVRAGDLVFFKWDELDGVGDEHHDNAFMNIDHVAMYLDRKNETYHQTIQYEENTPQFLFEVGNRYMEQCVLVVRFPFVNVDDRDTKNLIVNGNTKKVCSNAITVGTYYLNKKLVKGKMYSLTINGKIDTPYAYFVGQDLKGNTIFSDYGRTTQLNGTMVFYFLYQGEGVDVIKILLGSTDSSVTQRNGYINWCSLNEGYKIISNYYIPSNNANKRDLELNDVITSKLNSGYTPSYKICEYDDYFIVNIHLSVNEDFITNTIVIGHLGFTINKTTKIPCNFISHDNTSFNGFIQFKWDGEISIIKLDSSATWRHATASGMVIK